MSTRKCACVMEHKNVRAAYGTQLSQEREENRYANFLRAVTIEGSGVSYAKDFLKARFR